MSWIEKSQPHEEEVPPTIHVMVINPDLTLATVCGEPYMDGTTAVGNIPVATCPACLSREAKSTDELDRHCAREQIKQAKPAQLSIDEWLASKGLVVVGEAESILPPKEGKGY